MVPVQQTSLTASSLDGTVTLVLAHRGLANHEPASLHLLVQLANVRARVGCRVHEDVEVPPGATHTVLTHNGHRDDGS